MMESETTSLSLMSSSSMMESNETTSEVIAASNKVTYKKFVDSDGKEVMTRTPALRFICCICKSTYKMKLPCIKHLLVEHEIVVKEVRGSVPFLTAKNRYDCPKCSKTYTKRNNLYRHIRKAHKGDGLQDLIKEDSEADMPIACPMCGKGFATFGGVNRHIRRYHTYDFDPELQSSSDMIPCKLCDMRFPTDPSLTKHMKGFHHALAVSRLNLDGYKEDVFECGVCSVQIKEPSELRDHLSQLHEKYDFPIEITSDTEDKEESNQVFNCDRCRTFFKTEQEWRSHMKEAHNACPDSSCRRCGSSFSTYHDLKCHLKDVHFFSIPEGTYNVAPMHRVGSDLGLSRNLWVAMEKIPKWLVKHGDGQLLVVVHKDA